VFSWFFLFVVFSFRRGFLFLFSLALRFFL